jgi:transcriptional regulator with XRE-family HTH domain
MDGFNRIIGGCNVLTEFGRFLRKLRIDHGELIKDMAEKLEVTASYLSAVETGKRNIPETWADRIAKFYYLNEDDKIRLQTAALHSAKIIILPIKNAGEHKKETAVLFAREFEGMSDELLTQIRDLIKKNM